MVRHLEPAPVAPVAVAGPAPGWAVGSAEPFYAVRPIGPDDADALNAFHERCSEETHRLRFFSSQAHLRPEMLTYFVTVDHAERDALVAVIDDRIIGVARYDRTPPKPEATSGVVPPTAEVAFVVEDEFQGRGIASDLLVRLAALARERGIRRFVAVTLAENTMMQAVFRKSPMGAVMRRTPGDPSVYECIMDL